MNLSITDAGGSLLNMAQTEPFSDSAMDLKNVPKGTRAFAQKLDKTLRSAKQNNSDTPMVVQKPKNPMNQEKAVSKISDHLEEKSGYQFVSALRSILFMLSKGNLKDVSIDPSGLDAIKKMLLKAGFKEEDLDDLINELTEKSQEGEVSLDEVLNSLFKLPLADQKEDDDFSLIDADEVPFLESMLTTLGLTPEEIEPVFTKAKTGDQDFDLGTIIDELKNLQKKSVYNGTQYQTSKDNLNLQTTADSLGIQFDQVKDDQVTLSDMIKALEGLKVQKQNSGLQNDSAVTEPSDQTGKENPVDVLNELFKSLKTQNQESGNQAIDVAVDKINEKFDGVNFIADGKDVGKESSFGFENPKALKQEELDGIFKKVEAMLEPQTKEMPSDKELLNDLKSLKKSMTGTKKHADQSQFSLTQTKSEISMVKAQIQKPAAPVKTLPAYVTQQVGKSLVRAINQGENNLTIQLKPPELGRLLLSIDHSNNTMKVNIMTENHAAKEILSHNVTELKTVLSNSGVNLEKFEVDMSSDFRQSMADARQQSGNFGKRNRQRTAGQGITSRQIDGITNESILSRLETDGSVHLVA